MSRGLFNSSVVRIVNDAAMFLINAPVVGRLIGRGLVVIRYVGRRSGETFELPVGYRRSGGNLVIGVTAPDAKNWWRNFLGEGAPITLVNLNGADRNGHAVANRDARGRVSVIPAALHEVGKPSEALSRPRARPTTTPTAIGIAMICHQGIGPPEFATAGA